MKFTVCCLNQKTKIYILNLLCVFNYYILTNLTGPII